MRAKRSKQYRKLMNQYALTFNFREPYQVLLDAEIIKAGSNYKMRLGSMLENTLHGTIKPMITQCCIRHLYSAEIDPKNPDAKRTKDEWIDVAKGAERRRCGHHELETPLSAVECIKSVVDAKDTGANKHRYVVASQEQNVRKAMRAIAGVPLIYINRSVMILEPMAAKTSEARERDENAKVRAGLKSKRGAMSDVPTMKRAREDEGEDKDAAPQAKKVKKAKGPKGPNPLSVKKSKLVKKAGGENENGNGATSRPKPAADAKSEPKSTEAGGENDGEDNADASGKRKRKRKPKTGTTEATEGGAEAEAEAEADGADE